MPHSVAYLIERGFEPLVAASAFGFAGMLSAFGIIGVGWLSDRFGRRQTATLTYLSTIIGIVALSLVTLFPSLLLVYAFVFFFGLMQGARGPIIVAMVAQLFPRRRRRGVRERCRWRKGSAPDSARGARACSTS